MDDRRFDTFVRHFAAGRSRRGLLRLLTALPLASSLAILLDAGDAARADGSGAGVGGGHGRRKRRKARHRHHPGDNKDHRKGKRKGKRKARNNARCALCRTGESCTKGVCSCGTGPGCTAAGEICQSGICHNPYGCTPAMNFCAAGTPTPCPGNPNGMCINAPEGQFCVDITVSDCAPDNTCATCPAGTDCITLSGVCAGACTKGCAVPPPPP